MGSGVWARSRSGLTGVLKWPPQVRQSRCRPAGRLPAQPSPPGSPVTGSPLTFRSVFWGQRQGWCQESLGGWSGPAAALSAGRPPSRPGLLVASPQWPLRGAPAACEGLQPAPGSGRISPLPAVSQPLSANGCAHVRSGRAQLGSGQTLARRPSACRSACVAARRSARRAQQPRGGASAPVTSAAVRSRRGLSVLHG